MQRLSASQRQVVSLVEVFQNAILILELFKDKAKTALEVIKWELDELSEGGTEERDQFRYRMLDFLARHLREVHNLEG